jgi:hypothetical protein
MGNEKWKMENGTRKDGALRTLRQFVRDKAPAERCDLCSAELAGDHQHLIEPPSRQIVCACDACAILFTSGGETKYKRAPRRILFLPDFQMTDAQWGSLMIPISLAFFFHSAAAGRMVALYPSPAGPIESLLDLEAWAEIARANPVLKEIEPDVEGLLANRVGSAREHFIAPIDECFKLAGLIRAHWRGLSGGAQAWKEIDRFFAGLKQRSALRREESLA